MPTSQTVQRAHDNHPPPSQVSKVKVVSLETGAKLSTNDVAAIKQPDTADTDSESVTSDNTGGEAAYSSSPAVRCSSRRAMAVRPTCAMWSTIVYAHSAAAPR